jgi:enamine deaminase RidA (YjgF/YER057c/UK114 family)
MASRLDRRELLKKVALGSVAVGSTRITNLGALVFAQRAGSGSPASGVNFVRASLANGFIVHAGATAMELYHEHPHLQREEIVQPDDIRSQTRLVMRNHKEILDWLGLGWRNVVKLTCYLKRMNETKQIHDVLASYFLDWRPAITTVEINGLSSPQARLEIDMWVRPDARIVTARTGNVEGVEEVFPRPEVTNRVAYALAVKVSSAMDLLFFRDQRVSVRRGSLAPRHIQAAGRSEKPRQGVDRQFGQRLHGGRYHPAAHDAWCDVYGGSGCGAKFCRQDRKLAFAWHRAPGDRHGRAGREVSAAAYRRRPGEERGVQGARSGPRDGASPSAR